MGLKCYICNCYDSKIQSLFRIPNRNEENSERWRLWLKIVEEKEQNINKIRICSRHFLNRKPAKKEDYLNVDWVPNQNLGRFEKNKKLIDYHLRKRAIPSKQENLKGNDNNDVTTSIQRSQFVGMNQQQQNVSTAAKLNDQFSGDESFTPSKCVDVNLPLPFPKKRRIDIIEQKFIFSKSVQTELTSEEIDLLFNYYKEAVEDRERLLQQISTLIIDVNFFENNDRKTLFYTGLTTWKLLNRFFKLVEPFIPEHGNMKLSPFQILALTLMKLRLNLTFMDLGYRFQVDACTASKYFHRCIYLLYKLFFDSKLVYWPEDRAKLLCNTPSYFRSSFKEAVTIIIDCFEIFIERSTVLRALAQSWSQYKHHVTLKYLIGISTTGAIIFISEGFGGRASDKEVTIKSGFLVKLKDGDVVLADKGFLIENEVLEKNASLRLPCFIRKKNQLHPNEVEETREVASVRIHVERLISVVRQKNTICSDVVSMSTISKKNDLFDNDLYDKIIYVCCGLVNMCPSVVRNDFEI